MDCTLEQIFRLLNSKGFEPGQIRFKTLNDVRLFAYVGILQFDIDSICMQKCTTFLNISFGEIEDPQSVCTFFEVFIVFSF